jgi:signal transduction histidine kinase
MGATTAHRPTVERLARDLHDSVMQDLYALALRLDDAAGDAVSSPIVMRSLAADARSIIDALRDEVLELRSAAGADIGEELASVVARFHGIGGAEVLLRTDGVLPDAGLRRDVRNVVREAVSNAIRHGRAGHVDVTVFVGDGQVEVTVTDDGASDRPFEPRGGLLNIAARAEQRGGQVRLGCGPSGTHLRWVVPTRKGAKHK